MKTLSKSAAFLMTLVAAFGSWAEPADAAVYGYDPYNTYIEVSTAPQTSGSVRTFHHFYCNLYSVENGTGSAYTATTHCYQRYVTESLVNGAWVETQAQAENVTALTELYLKQWSALPGSGPAGEDTKTITPGASTNASLSVDFLCGAACATAAACLPPCNGADIKVDHRFRFASGWLAALPPTWDPAGTEPAATCDLTSSSPTFRPTNTSNKCTRWASDTDRYFVHTEYYYKV